MIGGRVIAPGDGEGDYTISTSALALLRTLDSDHVPGHWVADNLILHCGMLEMLSCPIGINWSVTHFGGRVHLQDVVRYDSLDETEAEHFAGLAVEVAEEEYRRRIVTFAQRAKEPFAGIEKTFYNDFDRQQYEEFWAEYDGLLNPAAQ